MTPTATPFPQPLRLGVRGLLKACAWCRRVRDHHGRWGATAADIKELRCTHGICRDCAQQHFPEVEVPE